MSPSVQLSFVVRLLSWPYLLILTDALAAWRDSLWSQPWSVTPSLIGRLSLVLSRSWYLSVYHVNTVVSSRGLPQFEISFINNLLTLIEQSTTVILLKFYNFFVRLYIKHKGVFGICFRVSSVRAKVADVRFPMNRIKSYSRNKLTRKQQHRGRGAFSPCKRPRCKIQQKSFGTLGRDGYDPFLNLVIPFFCCSRYCNWIETYDPSF